ncbi:VirB4 family type IV secretion system protein [Halocatena halophila]|uniref:VirB4 family type IV secretion system protein n=1 Tax=Halocatena halophila TaxID=2814576 RepID=UPI002ED1B06A
MDPSTNDNNSSVSGLILPHVDTTVTIKGIVTFDNMYSFAVPVAAFVVALLAWSINMFVIAALAFTITLVALPVVLYLTYTNPYYLSSWERIERFVESRRLQQKFPYQYHETLGREIHGVKRLYPDGTAKMNDGRRVGLIGVEGMNACRITDEQASTYVETLTSGIDEQIKDLPFSIYSTSASFDPESLVEHLTEQTTAIEESSRETDSKTKQYISELLSDVASWFIETESEMWEANRWEYYIVVSVHPDELHVDPVSDGAGVIPRLNPFSTTNENEQAQAVETELRAELDNRMATFESALSSVKGINSDRAGVLDTTRVLLRYWSGEPNLTHGSEIQRSMADDDSRVNVGESPTERLLTPSKLDAADGRIEVGDELCKTFCIMGWPVEPPPMFLANLFTMRTANVDVKLHVGPEHKQATIDELERLYADVESEEMERVQKMDASKIQIQNDKDAVRKMYLLLRNTTAQPWKVSMYVTVRVGPEEAHEYATKTGRNSDSLYLSKVRALEDACDDVLEVLTSAPAGLGPRQPSTDVSALDMFESSSPTGTDLYHEKGDKPKRTRMLGGAVAATFPWCAGVMQESGGLRFGRNKQNGSAIFADPFERGAPHMLTLGQTRSGKTYSVETALAEWFCSDPSRSLIVCDTEQGFEGLTQLCGGTHIVVDGEQTINPFDIHRPPQRVREANIGGSSHFQMKIDEVTSFFAGILRAQGIDPSPYISTIEDAVQQTYETRGISHDPATHATDSPTITDFVGVLEQMLTTPERFTFTGHEREAEQRVRVVSDLLDKLSGFKENRKYHHMVGETDTGILDSETDMAYIDLSQFNEASEADKSVMLHLIFGQVYQKVKRTAGEIIFLIDEAHFLLHSEEMIEYLQDAARSWARYDAALWFVTQSPREFIQRAQSIGAGQENQRRTILDQCSIIQTFRTPRIETEMLMDGLGQNRLQAEFVRNAAVTGSTESQYSECLIHFQDREGWWESHIEASPFEDLVWNYAGRTHGDFDRYLQNNWDGFDDSVLPSLDPPSHESATSEKKDNTVSELFSEKPATNGEEYTEPYGEQ